MCQPSEFLTLYRDIDIYPLCCPWTKNTTFTPIDTGSLKIFQKGTKRQKACRIFGGVKAYFFVDKTAMYIHKFLTLWTSTCVILTLTSTDDGHPKFQNKTMSRKARQFWQPNGRIHLFVNAYCTYAYHTYAYILSHGLPTK
jgi:hypothetical protein